MIIDIEKIKKEKIIKDPWEHKIIDNFFPEHEYQRIRKVAVEMSAQVLKDQTTYPMWMNEVLARGGDPKAVDCIIDSASEILDNLNYLLEDFTDTQKSTQGYFAMPKFGISGKDFRYPIHTESSHKVILFVIYLYPEEDVGTKLYSSQDASTFVSAIEWKENRAFLTAIKSSNQTWHNWSGNKNPSRITLNIFCEKIEELENSIMRSGSQDKDQLDDLLWLYDKIAQGKLVTNKV